MWDEGGDDTNQTDAEGVPEADPTAEGGEGPDVAYPEGYGPGGVEDARTALSTHMGNLSGHDSYMFTYDALIEQNGSETSLGIIHHVNNENEVAYQIQNRPNASVVVYFEDQRAFIRQEAGGEVRYRAIDQNYSMTDFSGYQYVGPLLAQVDYKDAEVIETDAGTFYHYVSDEVVNPQGILRNTVDENRIDRFDVAIVVDEEGVIRHANFVVEADRNITVTMDVGETDSVDVDRPDWYDEAAENGTSDGS
jgi:hypothetical protein